jgi:hypothetical protein
MSDRIIMLRSLCDLQPLLHYSLLVAHVHTWFPKLSIYTIRNKQQPSIYPSQALCSIQPINITKVIM